MLHMCAQRTTVIFMIMMMRCHAEFKQQKFVLIIKLIVFKKLYFFVFFSLSLAMFIVCAYVIGLKSWMGHCKTQQLLQASIQQTTTNLE